jgi:hypothetical protein
VTARILVDVTKHPANRFLTLVLSVLLTLVTATFAAPPSSTGPAASAPARRPATTHATSKPASRPVAASKPTDEKVAKARKFLELTRRSIKLLNDKKYPEAERILNEALALQPDEPTTLYNLACLYALTDRKDQAVAYLQKSVDAGFIDFIHISKDSDLDSLHEDERYKALMAKKDFYYHKAAEAVVDGLKGEFGNDYLYEIDDADRLIFATDTDRFTLDALRTSLVRQAHSQWDQIFEHKPDQYIAVVVPSPRKFRAIELRVIGLPGVEGFYNHEARTLIASGLGFVTMHEFTHALHAADLDPLGQEHPIWLVEGMAVLFERAEYEKGPDGQDVLTPQDNARLGPLQRAARRDKLVPLDKLLKLSQKDFVRSDDVLLHYAESGSVMHYLYEQKLLRKFYDTFKAGYDKDKTGKTALEQVTGKSLEDFEKDWKAWMLKRTAPAMYTGPTGAYLGIQFGDANDGLLVHTLDRNGPAAKAGIRVGDLIVGVDGTEVRDEPTFLPLLAAHQPGDTLILRLRRNHAYLELPMKLGSRNAANSGGRPGRN